MSKRWQAFMMKTVVRAVLWRWAKSECERVRLKNELRRLRSAL
jgi:hypothetical protein